MKEKDEKDKKQKKQDQPHTNKGPQDFQSVRQSDVEAGSGNLSQTVHDRRADKFGPDRKSDTIGV